MGEFAPHYRQKRMRHQPLCDHCVGLLVKPHDMVPIVGLGDECTWCGYYDQRHVPATHLVDLRVGRARDSSESG